MEQLQNHSVVQMRPFSFAVLAGGCSSRMGCDKADLFWNGKTFLQHQIDKASALGCTEIMVSGGVHRQPGTLYVADIFPNRGPLGGIYSCLVRAAEDCCLFLSVDVPQVSAGTLQQLLNLYWASGADAAILHTARGDEPLIGVYRTSVQKSIRPLLETGSPGVYRLLSKIHIATLDAPSSEVIINCNTPQDLMYLYQG